MKSLDRGTLHWAMRRLFSMGYPDQAALLAAEFNDQAHRGTVRLTERKPEVWVADHPEDDATDAAHPAWWRGHDNGAKGMAALVAKLRAQVAALEGQLHEVAASPRPVQGAPVAGEAEPEGDFPPFGCDPGDSAALEKLRTAIDDADLWPSEATKEAGDYEAAVVFMARVTRPALSAAARGETTITVQLLRERIIRMIECAPEDAPENAEGLLDLLDLEITCEWERAQQAEAQLRDCDAERAALVGLLQQLRDRRFAPADDADRQGLTWRLHAAEWAKLDALCPRTASEETPSPSPELRPVELAGAGRSVDGDGAGPSAGYTVDETNAYDSRSRPPQPASEASKDTPVTVEFLTSAIMTVCRECPEVKDRLLVLHDHLLGAAKRARKADT